MSLSGKKTLQVGVKCNSDVLYALFRHNLPEFLIIAPEYLKSCELQEGECGATGCVMLWNIVLDGKKQVVKHSMEAIDEKNKFLTYNIFEGDFMTIFKTFKAHVKIDGSDENSIVTWTLEYEKMNEKIPEPDSIVEAIQNITKYLETRMNPDSLADVKIPQLQ